MERLPRIVASCNPCAWIVFQLEQQSPAKGDPVDDSARVAAIDASSYRRRCFIVPSAGFVVRLQSRCAALPSTSRRFAAHRELSRFTSVLATGLYEMFCLIIRHNKSSKNQ
jgi:hypothetical protein